ncbi:MULTISPECIES: helix-turn-helix transcriptional regulator [Amycolatopsis]|uniref:Helix-turn-helix transcriptional regulator n=1 Tax=Amycolatopsis albidoflavus TaxID=102226 RepID=A0ABW5IAS6_9PSEU
MATADRKMTVNEVCAELADENGKPLARSTFYDWRAKNRGPKCTRLPNGDLRIRRADFDRWFDSLAEENV